MGDFVTICRGMTNLRWQKVSLSPRLLSMAASYDNYSDEDERFFDQDAREKADELIGRESDYAEQVIKDDKPSLGDVTPAAHAAYAIYAASSLAFTVPYVPKAYAVANPLSAYAIDAARNANHISASRFGEDVIKHIFGATSVDSAKVQDAISKSCRNIIRRYFPNAPDLQ